nr:MAG TPA_asm: minor tail protein [Caudoviricetes sp.]
MSGIANWQAQIRIDIEDLKKRIKVAEGEINNFTNEDRKVKLDIDTKTLESAIQKLDKMLDSLGKGTGDFKQFENLSKELSSIVLEVQSLSKAFGKVDDSGAKTLLSSIQNIDKSLSELSQNILNVNKNINNMGGNTSGAVKQVENISNAYQDAAKEAEKLADVQSKIGQKTNISSDISSQVKVSDSITDQIVANEKKKQEAYKATTETVMYHAGVISKLNKAETNGRFYGSDRGTGYFGTGHYFVDSNTKHELDNNSSYSSLPYTSIDISKYDNLFKATSDEVADALHTFLKNLTKFTQGSDSFDVSELFSQFQKVFGETTMDMQEFDAKLSQLKAYMQSSNMSDRGDSVSTQFMKSLGYGGVDTRGTKYADTRYGTVIYDLKEESVLQANITDELQKQGQMLEKITYEKGQVFDKSEDTRIQGILDQQAKAKEIETEFNKIFDSTNLNTYNSELDSVNQKLTENESIINNCKSAIETADEDAKRFAKEMAEFDLHMSDEEIAETANKNKVEYQERIEELSKEQSLLKDRKQEIESNLDAEYKLANAARERATATVEDRMKDAFPNADSTASVEKIADGFKEVKQNTEQATEVTEKYQRVLSQVGELGVDAKVSAMYQRNDGQLESVSWKAKRDDQGQILYDKNGNIDYDFNSTVISKYEQLEKIITTADNKLRDLQKSLKDTQNLNSNASTKNIEEQIQYQKDYIQLLEQTVKAISQQDEYLLYEQQIIDARAKAEKEYNLNQGTKSDISNAKQLASDEQKRQKSIEQTNRLLNKQQIIIDGIEKSYSKAANNDLDKAVNSQSDLAELEKKKNLIQFLLNGLKNEDRNSSNEKEFLQVEKLIAEYKQLAKDKLKANNPSKQELGGQELDVLLANQVTQYNKLISQSEKYGDATKEITNELKAQRDLIAEQDKNGVYVARSKKADGSEITANDYYDARDNYKISKSIFSSYETDIKSASNMAKQEASNIQAEWDKNIKAIQDYMDAMTKLNNLKAKDKGTGSEANQIALQTQNVEELKKTAFEARQNLSSMQAENPDVIAWKQWVDMMELFVQASKGSAESAAKLKDVLDNIKVPSLDKYENKLASYQTKKAGYDATIARFKDGGWTSDEYLKNVQAVKDAVKKYEDLLSNIKAKGGITSEEDVQKLKEYESEIKKTISTVTNMSAAEKGYNFVSAQKELDKIHKLLAENSKMSSEAKAKIQAYYREIESGNPSMSLDKIHGEILKIYNAEVEAGRAGRSFFDTLKNSGFHQLAAQMAGMFGFYDVINLGKQAFSTVKELDYALVDLKKTTAMNSSELEQFYYDSNDVAKQMGVTTKEIIDQASSWSRLNKIGLLYGDI